MSKRIYAGNLSFKTNEETLKQLFEGFGEVISAEIITDKNTGLSKGFGFVEASDEFPVEKAVSALSGKEVDGRKIRVSPADEKRASEGKTGEGKESRISDGFSGSRRSNGRRGNYRGARKYMRQSDDE